MGNIVVISATLTLGFEDLIEGTSANSSKEMSVCCPRNAAVAAAGSMTYCRRTSSR